jgi:hypothetical protein
LKVFPLPTVFTGRTPRNLLTETILPKTDRLREIAEAPALSACSAFTDVIVAVHGIGEQARFATVRSVATRLASSEAFRLNGKADPLTVQPLGYFHGDAKNLASLLQLDDADNLKDTDLAKIGFAEVYWADIPDDVLQEGRTLEETKAWARTVVARANALCRKSRQDDPQASLVTPDFDHAGDVLDEIIDTVHVLENLVFIAKKAGILKFDLQRILMEYLGDVQLVTEFAYHRKNILGRFHQAMQQIHEKSPNARIHIVAHSEGTVVSFLGLLWAMSKKTFIPEQPPNQLEAKDGEDGFPAWLLQIHGFMTIGSPIDKHLLLWRRLWTSQPFKPHLVSDLEKFKDGQIRWRNYYDYGDPVGFKLDSARLWLKQIGCKAFEFCGCKECHHDIGFARYLLPGEAHNEYWNDPAVFKHFILDVVKRDGKVGESRPNVPVPKDKWYVAIFSPVLPYILSLVVIGAGVFILFKAVYAYTHPNLEPLQKFVRFFQLGAQVSGELTGITIFRAVLGITALLAGTVFLARVPHLAMTWPWTRTRRLIRRGLTKPRMQPLARRLVPKLELARKFVHKIPIRMWTVVGAIGFLIGCALYVRLVPTDVRNDIGSAFTFIGPLCPKGWGPTIGVLIVTVLLAAISEILVAKGTSSALQKPSEASETPKKDITAAPKKTNWHRRWLFQGLRPFILLAAVAASITVIIEVQPPKVESLGFTAQELASLTLADIKTIRDARFSSNELAEIKVARGTNWLATVKKVEPVLAVDPPIWPLVLAGAAFLYLLWLGALVFDLAFVWHRYIRNSITNDRLREWNPYGFSRRWETGEEECCNVLKHPVASQ